MLPLPRQRRRRVRRAAQRVVGGGPARRDATRSISSRIAIIASQNRSSSARSSLSVGSIISVPGDRERHRRRVEAVVDQPLGHVVDGDAGVLGDGAQVDDALVRDQAGPTGVEHREVRAEPGGDVVGVEDRDLGRAGQARRRPSAARRPTRSAGCRPSPTAPRTPGRRRSPGRPRPASGGSAGTAPGARARRPGRRRDRRRRAGCRTSCAGSGATRRRRSAPAGPRPTSALRFAPST